MKSTRVVKSAAVFCVMAMVFAGGLSACGQKGPLYLPQQQSKPKPEAAPVVQPDAPAKQVAPVADPS